MGPSTDFDVIIAGAGPTGAVLAALLGQAGVRTLVLERDRAVYPLPRAVHLDHEALRILQGIGLSKDIDSIGEPAEDYLFLNAAGEALVEIRQGAGLAVSGFCHSFMFFQPALDKLLRRRLGELPAVAARFGSSLTGIELPPAMPPDGPGQPVRAWFEGDDGLEVASARFLVGCDGAASLVRSSLGVPLDDLGFNEPWIAVDVQVADDSPLPARAAYQYCDPGRPATSVPSGPGRRQWQFMVLPGEQPESLVREESVRGLLRPWFGDQSPEIERIAAYRFHAAIARQWRVGPVLLAGDAAHQAPPFMGQGLCTGLRDAACLAWMLERVISGASPPSLLDRYQPDRESHVRFMVEASMQMGRVVCELDRDRAAERDRALLAARQAGMGGLAWSSVQLARLEGGVVRPGDPASGWLFPQPFVQVDGGMARLDDVAPRGFCLFADSQAVLPPEDRLAAMGVRSMVLGDPPAAELPEAGGNSALGWLRDRGIRAVLVRPDHYVYGSAVDRRGSLELLEDLWSSLAAGVGD